MELIRPLYCVHEEDIIAWKRYNRLEFLQCACRFTERISESGDGVGPSKRQEVKQLLKALRRGTRRKNTAHKQNDKGRRRFAVTVPIHNRRKRKMDVDTCIICGEPIPEGVQVCPLCEAGMKKDDANDECNYFPQIFKGDIYYADLNPVHVPIEASSGGLPSDSTIMLEQIRTIDKTRIKGFIGHLDDKTMQLVDTAAKIALGINI